MDIRQYRDSLVGRLQDNLSKLSEKLQTLKSIETEKEFDVCIEGQNKTIQMLQNLNRLDKFLDILEKLPCSEVLIKLEINFLELNRIINGHKPKNKYFYCLVNDVYFSVNK